MPSIGIRADLAPYSAEDFAATMEKVRGQFDQAHAAAYPRLEAFVAALKGESMVAETDFEEVEIARQDAPDVRFRGRLVAEVDSKDETRENRKPKERWKRLELWELETGDWVAASIACSDREGEIDFADADGVLIIREAGRLTNEGARGVDAMRKEAMEFFGWTWLAKALAERAGWDVVEEIR